MWILAGTGTYLIGLGLHCHHSVKGNHEDHHSHPGQDRRAQILEKERRQPLKHREEQDIHVLHSHLPYTDPAK